MSTRTELADAIAECNTALINLDTAYLRKLMPGAPTDEIRLMAAHKARYECVGIPAEFRHASGAWLRQHGWKRMSGDELLPEGELPK